MYLKSYWPFTKIIVPLLTLIKWSIHSLSRLMIAFMRSNYKEINSTDYQCFDALPVIVKYFFHSVNRRSWDSFPGVKEKWGYKEQNKRSEYIFQSK